MSECRLLCGDAITVLKTLESASVQLCVTSPPYFGLRSYLPADHPDKAHEIGAEPSLAAYVAHLVGVFEEVKRVLRDDGTCWINLGDTYAGGPTANVGRNDAGRNFTGGGGNRLGTGNPGRQGTAMRLTGLKPKDLIGVPWRVAFALQDAGWYLRSDIILVKSNPMPESVTDRPTRSHEYLFMLAKSERYAYDADAIAEPVVRGSAGSSFITGKTLVLGAGRTSTLRARAERETKNKRDVWAYQADNFEGAHYAVMPCRVIEPCVLAGSQPGDTVLDPFMGTASTGMVALSHGRSYIGIDLDERNIELARHRIGPMLLSEPCATTPPVRITDKQAGAGTRTAVGVAARWDAQEREVGT